jgi:hypothetical protein
MRAFAVIAGLILAAGPVRAQSPETFTLGPAFYWGSLCAAGECVESVNGGGASVRAVLPLANRLGGDLTAAYWYGSTRDATVQRFSLFLAARFYPSTRAPVFVKGGGGISWEKDGGRGHAAGILGVGWDVREWIGAQVTPFVDAAFFGPPDPLPTLRLVSGGVELAWPW